MTKTTFRESKQRQREKWKSCTWYIKGANDFCHDKPVSGAKFCKTHASYMKRWVARKHRESYSKQNDVSWGGWSKFDE